MSSPPKWFPNPGELYNHSRVGLCIVLAAVEPKSVGCHWQLRVLANKGKPTVLDNISIWDMQFVSAP